MKWLYGDDGDWCIWYAAGVQLIISIGFTLVRDPGVCEFCKHQVAKRENYLDPEKKGGRDYKFCRPCVDRHTALVREAS